MNLCVVLPFQLTESNNAFRNFFQSLKQDVLWKVQMKTINVHMEKGAEKLLLFVNVIIFRSLVCLSVILSVDRGLHVITVDPLKLVHLDIP